VKRYGFPFAAKPRSQNGLTAQAFDVEGAEDTDHNLARPTANRAGGKVQPNDRDYGRGAGSAVRCSAVTVGPGWIIYLFHARREFDFNCGFSLCKTDAAGARFSKILICSATRCAMRSSSPPSRANTNTEKGTKLRPLLCRNRRKLEKSERGRRFRLTLKASQPTI
jgi:hypothetical protein